jgi:DNA-damage-inducible protein J
MSKTNINIRTDSEVKQQAQEVLSQLGLDLSTAINLFLRQVVYKRGVNIELSLPEQKRKASLGGWEDKIVIADDFDDPLDIFEEYM